MCTENGDGLGGGVVGLIVGFSVGSGVGRGVGRGVGASVVVGVGLGGSAGWAVGEAEGTKIAVLGDGDGSGWSLFGATWLRRRRASSVAARAREAARALPTAS